MTFFAHFSRSFRETFPTRASEWAMGAILFLWSAVLTINSDFFLTAAMHPLARVASQETWAALCLSAGGGRLLVLAINGGWRRTPHLRAVTAFVSCFFWFQITIGLLQSHSIGTGLAVYPVLFFLDVYNVFRAARDAGSSDRIHTGARNGIDT
jgi:hypothetical protein